MTYRRNVLTSVLVLTVAVGALHCGDDSAVTPAPGPAAGGKAGAAGKAGGAGTSAAGSAGKAGTGGGGAGTAGQGGSSAGTGGTTAGSGGTTAGSGGTTAGSGGTTAGSGGTTAGSGGTAGSGAGFGGSAGIGGTSAGGAGQGGSGGTDQGGSGGTDQGGSGGTDQGGAGGEAGAGGAVVAPDFSVALDPSSVKIPQGAGASVNVNFVKQGDFDAAVTVEVIGLPAGVTAANVTLQPTETSVGLSIAATAGAAIGAAANVKVRATSGSIVHEVPLALEIVAPAATITSVQLLGPTGDAVLNYKQFRQGYPNLRIKVSGADLGTPVFGDVKLGNIAAKAIENGAGFFIATFDVPHGEMIGLHDLTLTKAGGVAKSAGVAEITAIISRPTGNDTTGRGTSESAYKTLTKANSMSAKDDTILLGQGTYTTAAGETFPIALAENVTLLGTLANGNYGSIIRATAAGQCLQNATSGTIARVALETCQVRKTGPGKLAINDVRSDDATLGVDVQAGEAAFTCTGTPAICEIRNGATGVRVATAATVSGDVRVRSASAVGLQLAGTATLDEALFVGNGPVSGDPAASPGGAIVLTGAATLTAKKLDITGVPRRGIRANDTSSVTIDAATFGSTSNIAGNRSFIELSDTSKLAIKTVTATAVAIGGNNIDFLELIGGSTATVDAGTYNGSTGQLVRGSSTSSAVVTLTGSKVNNFDEGAINLGAGFKGSVTLGAGTVFTSVGNATFAMLRDARTAATTGITVAPGSTFNGFTVPAGTKIAATPKLSANGVNVWNITGAGSIVFQ